MHLFAIEGNDFRTPDRRQKVEFTVQDGPKRSVSCQRHRTQKNYLSYYLSSLPALSGLAISPLRL